MKSQVIIILLLFVGLAACNKKPVYQSQGRDNDSPSSLNPNSERSQASRSQYPKQETYFFGLFKKKQKLNSADQLIAEYEERMKTNAKEARKKAKEMEKPQYSDYTYFGHKKKPKKRPPGKMKYCKECGIRH